MSLKSYISGFHINEIPMWYFQSKCATDKKLQKWMKDNKKDYFHDKPTEEMAKAYCSDCPFRLECLDLAMRNLGYFQGVMGGMTLRERKALAKKQLKRQQEIAAKIEEFQARLKARSQDDIGPTAA